MIVIFLIAMALAPGAAIALFIYLRDGHEPEPIRALILGLLAGVLSFFISLGIGYVLHNVTHMEPTDVVAQIVRAFVFVGLLEEGCKFLFLRGYFYRLPHFDEPFDGIVYAIMIGMGFASAENIVYVLQGGGGTALIRMFTAVPGHAVFAVIMGYFVGEARVFSTSSGLYLTMGLIFATFAHGVYDYFLFISFIPGLWIQALVSLIVAIILTYFAIKRHEQESPFREDDE
jgi:RsiW-degrading membrane proteinase PrsW (M82 family)